VSPAGRRRGRVILVGAGPGDPDLITVRGLHALREADAVVYDSLAPPELLRLARPDASLHDVGKRGHDAPTRPQPEINALLVELARGGRTVVRLKGGDPFVFGRGGEEASACVEAGLEVEVVPGISSALAALAYAGIPVTDRRHSASFAVVTGHKDPTRVAAETRWEALATAVDTLVILMGMRNLEELVRRVLAGGRDPRTPAAVVMNGTLPGQKVVVAPLDELVARARAAGVASPAAVVIGDVVRLRETLAWFENRPLFGKRVLVTRDASQSESMVEALRAAGAQAVVLPMIELAPPESWDAVDAVLDRVASYDAVLVTSANALRFLAARAAERGVALARPGLHFLCVGPKTAEVTRAAGIPVHLVPEQRYDAEGLADAISKHLPPRGRRFLFPCADKARDVLPERLTVAGGCVDSVTVYRNRPSDVSSADLRRVLVEEGLDALTFTSPSTVVNFSERLDEESRAAAQRCTVAAIGPVTARALREVGLAPTVLAERAGVEELVAALAEQMSGEHEGGSR